MLDPCAHPRWDDSNPVFKFFDLFGHPNDHVTSHLEQKSRRHGLIRAIHPAIQNWGLFEP
jgi:hypothetical protein